MTIPTAGRATGRARAPSSGRSLFLWPVPTDGWIALAGVALIYFAHWIYGAQGNQWALLLTLAAAILLGATLCASRVRADLMRLNGLAVPAVLFALVILVALWSLTPWVPGGPHPVWAFVGLGPGASTIDLSSTAIQIIRLLGLACLFAIGLATGARDDRARYAIRLTLAAGAVFGLWAFFGAVTGAVYQSQGRRLEAHFLSPNTAGTLFGILLVLGIAELAAVLRSREGRRDQLGVAAPGLAILIFATCLLDTASRGATLSTLGALGVFGALQLWMGRLKPSRGVLAALGGLAAFALVVAVVGDNLLDRAFHGSESAAGRLDIWRPHWDAFLDSPLFGYGLGSFDTVNKMITDDSNIVALWNIHGAHNVYLHWLEEAGLIGAAPMFACIGALMLLTLRGLRQRSRMIGLISALLAVDALVLLHGITDIGLQVPSLVGFWAWLLGLQVSLSQSSTRR